MARFADVPELREERDIAAFLRRLPAWATNPVIRRADEVDVRAGWWMATVEVDAPPARKESE